MPVCAIILKLFLPYLAFNLPIESFTPLKPHYSEFRTIFAGLRTVNRFLLWYFSIFQPLLILLIIIFSPIGLKSVMVFPIPLFLKVGLLNCPSFVVQPKELYLGPNFFLYTLPS